MSQTQADVSHYYQRLAELSTLPFWQRREVTEPTGLSRAGETDTLPCASAAQGV
jgi:hypothetical protein